MKAGIIILLAAFIIEYNTVAQTQVRVLFYNAENLFDTVNDTLTDDDEFLPDGIRRWTGYRYHRKLDAVARVIIAAGEWDPPEVVGMCEVENSQVISDLAGGEMLARAGYSFVSYESPDPRGIDVCLLYQREKVTVIMHEDWIPVADDGTAIRGRDVLFVKTLIAGDTVDFVVCHWPSRRDGVTESEDRRRIVADFTAEKIDSVRTFSDGSEKIVVMGDLNSSPNDDNVVRMARTARLVNLTAPAARKGAGTYRFRGEWEVVDQVLVSEDIAMDNADTISECETKAVIFDPDFLLEDDPDYPGRRPYSTFREYKWQGGFSDHLPVLLTLCL